MYISIAMMTHHIYVSNFYNMTLTFHTFKLEVSYSIPLIANV